MAETMQKEWEGFVGGAWTSNVNVRELHSEELHTV